jgi:hypothetical protein
MVLRKREPRCISAAMEHTMSPRLLTTVLLGTITSSVAFAETPTWSQLAGTDSWELLSTKRRTDAGEVKVYRAIVEGVTCFQGMATADVPLEALLDVATDIESAIEWSSAGVLEAETLGRNGDTLDYYQYLDVPGWTLSADRFWFLRGVIERGAEETSFHWERSDVATQYAERYQQVAKDHPKAIEPPINVGGWTFRATDTGTEVRYRVCSDVGGALPRGVQNAATKGTLPDTVGDAVREARRRSQ